MKPRKFKTIKFKVPEEFAEFFERKANEMIKQYGGNDFAEPYKYMTMAEALGIRFEDGIHVYTTDLKETEKRFNDLVDKIEPETVGDRMVEVMDDFNRAELKVLQMQEILGKPVNRFYPCGCDRVCVNPNCKYGSRENHDIFFDN